MKIIISEKIPVTFQYTGFIEDQGVNYGFDAFIDVEVGGLDNVYWDDEDIHEDWSIQVMKYIRELRKNE